MSKRSFTYEPTFEESLKIVENKSVYDDFIKDANRFKPKVGSNLVRILPPGWNKPRHYGLYIKVHNNIGPKNRRYLCLRENENSPYKHCPICEELYKLGSRATIEDKKQLGVYDSILYYIVDRDNEKEGVQLWTTSTKLTADIVAQTIDMRRRSSINIVHPENGYDIEFMRKGTGFQGVNRTEYYGFKISREPSPISDDDKRFNEWLDVVYDRPLPSILQFYSPEHLHDVLYGYEKEDEESEAKSKPHLQEQSEEPSRLQRRRVVEHEEEEEGRTPRRRVQIQEDLDDEVPFDTKLNGRERVEEEVVSSRRERPKLDDEEDTQESPRRRRVVEEEQEEQPRPSRRRAAVSEDEEDITPLRERVRERLNRDRD